MASITQYRGKRWRAVVRRVGFKPVSKTFATKVQAETWATVIEAGQHTTGVVPDLREARSTTVAELLQHFADKVCPERKGAKWEQVRIARFLATAEFVHRRLDQLTPKDIRDWRDQRLTEVSGASVNREMNLLSGVFSHAIKERGVVLAENPVHLVARPKDKGRPRTRRWTPADLKKILDTCGWDPAKPPRVGRDYVPWVLLLGIETAMRLGEMCALRVGDVHLEERYVLVRDSKNGDARHVPLSKTAQELLRTLVRGRDEDELVVPVTSDSLGVYYRAKRNEAGLQDIRFHDTRHEAATRLSKRFSNVVELSAVTGHRSLQSLKRYYNPTVAELVSRLDD